jgi:O-antigen ligase
VAFKQYDQKLYNRLRGYYVDSSHNFILDWWVQGGFIGLGILLLLLFDAFKSFIRKKEKVYIVLLLGIVSVMSFNPMSVVTLVAFWWIVGLGALE